MKLKNTILKLFEKQMTNNKEENLGWSEEEKNDRDLCFQLSQHIRKINCG